MSDPDRTVKEGYRFVGFPWRAPEGKVVERVIFAPNVTGDEAYEIVKSLGWLRHKDAGGVSGIVERPPVRKLLMFRLCTLVILSADGQVLPPVIPDFFGTGPGSGSQGGPP